MATTCGFSYSYYTNIIKTINFDNFNAYLEYVSTQNMTEEIAETMSNIEQLIVNSIAYKSQGIKQPHQNKWQAYKIANKTPFTELCLILNRMNNNNIDELITEAVKYDTLSYIDIKQIADLLLGKCIKEPNNIEIYCKFFKQAVSSQLWYVYHDEKVVSFLDICLDQLEQNYKDLTKMAGYIEDMYETKKSINEEIVNGVIITQMHNSELYLKRKNIIVGVIEIIGSFYNNKIISATLIENIFDNLKERYDGNRDENDTNESTIKKTIKIYFELWLSLWNRVKFSLNENSYNTKYVWLEQMKEIINCDRLKILIENSLILSTKEVETTSLYLDDYIDTTKNLIAQLKTDDDFKEFAVKYKNDISKYVTKYLLEQCNIDYSKIKNMSEKIIGNLMTKEEFLNLIQNMLNNEDITCDYPNFVKYSNTMLR